MIVLDWTRWSTGASTYVPGSMRITAASGAAASAALMVTNCPVGPTVSTCTWHPWVEVSACCLRIEGTRHQAKRRAHVCARRARELCRGPGTLGDGYCRDRQQYASPRHVDGVVALADLCGAAADESEGRPAPRGEAVGGVCHHIKREERVGGASIHMRAKWPVSLSDDLSVPGCRGLDRVQQKLVSRRGHPACSGRSPLRAIHPDHACARANADGHRRRCRDLVHIRLVSSKQTFTFAHMRRGIDTSSN